MKKFITRWTSQGTLLEIHGTSPQVAMLEMEKVGATMIRWEAGVGYGIVDYPSLTLDKSLGEATKLAESGWSWLPWWRRAWKKWSGDELKKAVK